MTGKRIERIPLKYRKTVTQQLGALSAMIQAKREAMGLTQEGLAEDLSINPQTLAYIEQRRRYPSLPLLFFICAKLGIEVQFK